MLFVPVLAILISASIGKPEQARAPRWTLPLALFTAILVGMVLTNDLHQFIFTFPEGTAVFTDEDYSYGTGYYFVIGWEILCALAALSSLYNFVFTFIYNSSLFLSGIFPYSLTV